MIEIRQLTKRYGRKTAVDSLSFTVSPGHVTGFLGPNGAGKSTTMRAMVGLDHPTSGTVLIDGRHYREYREPLRKVGALLDAKGVHPGRTVRGHLVVMARSNRIPLARVDEVIDTVGLGDAADRRTRGLSLGMGQRLGIAAALLGDPEVLLFDEPVNGLDPEGIQWIRGLMRRLASEGRTVLVSSHLMAEMALTADHLIVIGQGRLLADLPTEEFVGNNSGSYVLVRTPDRDRLRDLLVAQGNTVRESGDDALEVDDTTSRMVGELAAEHRVTLYELTPRAASLEEAFMQLTASAVEYRAKEAV
ncbi:ABC transporter ATP-binding protein [Nocardiopsis alborubida]|uniref:ABC transporter ATP-binding protein n=1 Tax=Nocardiopsis alborubida TaxID=146802 RepID=A0A7X6MIG2_9ACTN|nr:ABC transporter ATP-binding protein [Nocardiopsis alborubida]NKZ01601.1 ABC transporter ATP-binding protein [Nocardiopsis alborubida]